MSRVTKSVKSTIATVEAHTKTTRLPCSRMSATAGGVRGMFGHFERQAGAEKGISGAGRITDNMCRLEGSSVVIGSRHGIPAESSVGSPESDRRSVADTVGGCCNPTGRGLVAAGHLKVVVARR